MKSIIFESIVMLFLAGVSVCSFSQEKDSIYTYQYVLDSYTRYGIPDAYITIADTNGIILDSMATARTYADGNIPYYWGRNLIRDSQVIVVKAEHPDYETALQRLEIKKPSRMQEYRFPDLLMKRRIKETTMEEVTVKATRIQLTYKGDTIVVDAEAFKIPEGSMLDALVSRVPGAELKSDGTIYMNGRKVDYLTLNGKDFFKGRNRIMLDNLPYYIVSKLKFFEKDVPLSQMQHADTGQKDYVMDVELKKEYSIGYMANAETGYGINDRWMGRLFGLRFTKHSRMTLFGGTNNVNEIKPLGSSGFNDGSGNPVGMDQTSLLGAGYSVEDRQGRYKGDVEGTLNWSDRYDEERSSREAFLTGAALGQGKIFNRSQSITRSRDFGTELSNRWALLKSDLSFETKVNYLRHNGGYMSRSATFNSDPSKYGTCLQVLDSIFDSAIKLTWHNNCVNNVYDETKYNGERYSLSQGINWDRLLPWGDELWIHAQGDYTEESRKEFNKYRLSYPDGTLSNNNIDRYMPFDQKKYSYSIQGTYVFHFRDDLLVNYVCDYAQQYSDTKSDIYRLDLLAINAGFGVLPSRHECLQILDTENSYKDLYMKKVLTNQIGVQKRLKGNGYMLVFRGSIPIVYKTEGIRYWRVHYYEENQRMWYAAPLAYMQYTNRSDRSLGLLNRVTINYQSVSQTPNLANKLDIVDTSNPLSIVHGNPKLKLARIHKLEMTAETGGISPHSHIKIRMNFMDNLVANGFTYNAKSGVYTCRPENVKGNWNAEAYIFYRTNLKKTKQAQIEGKSGINYVHNVDLARLEGCTSSQLSRVNHYVTSQNLKLSYNKESLRLEAMGDFAWNVTKRELNNQGDISAFDFSYGLSGQYTFLWKIQLATDLKMYSRRGYEEHSMNTNELVWNASVSRPFLKGKLVVKVDGFDILGQLSSTRYVVNGQGRTETWQLSMPRYAMLRVAYKFNKNPKKK